MVLVGLALICDSSHAIPYRDVPDNTPRPVLRWSNARVTLDLHGKTWFEVLTWFAKETQLELDVRFTPTYGLPTPIKPREGDRTPIECTLVEAFDILNERMQIDHQLVLLRLGRQLILTYDDGSKKFVPARVQVHELIDRGRTEIVNIVIKLKPEVDPDDYACDAKRLLGQFGDVTVLPGRQVLLRSDVGTLLRWSQNAEMQNGVVPR